jgi:hypothetical protein
MNVGLEHLVITDFVPEEVSRSRRLIDEGSGLDLPQCPRQKKRIR